MLTHTYTKLLLLLDAARLSRVTYLVLLETTMIKYIFFRSRKQHQSCKLRKNIVKLYMHMCVCVRGPRCWDLASDFVLVCERMSLIPWREHCRCTSCFAKDRCVSIYL